MNLSPFTGVHGASSFVDAVTPSAAKYVTSPVTALIFALRVNVNVSFTGSAALVPSFFT